MDLEEKEKALEALYSASTKAGLAGLEQFGDRFMPLIFVFGQDLKMHIIPLEKDKERVAKTVLAVCKACNALGVIMIAEGWNVLREEIFLATLESKSLNKMRVWKVKRDEQGNRMFPLEEVSYEKTYLVGYGELVNNGLGVCSN